MRVPSVSVIISVFGQLEYTKRCLSALKKTLEGKLGDGEVENVLKQAKVLANKAS